jgi:hypothetical protein
MQELRKRNFPPQCQSKFQQLIKDAENLAGGANPGCPDPREWPDGEETPTCVNVPDGDVRKAVWKDAYTKCYSADSAYNARIEALADAAFGPKRQGKVGCLTYPYRGDVYDLEVGMREKPEILNKAHAGIDLRGNGIPVFAITSGTVVERAYSPSKDRSTLIIETPDRRYKVLYLHMKDVTDKKQIIQGVDQVGIASNVGTPNAHLHIEVWPSSSLRYPEKRAIWGCGDARQTKCTDEQIAVLTVDPARFTESPPISADLPMLPVIDDSSVDIVRGKWRLNTPSELYKTPDDSSETFRQIKKDEWVNAVALQFYTRKYAVVELSQPKIVHFWDRSESGPRPRQEFDVSLAKGDKVAILRYFGEGECVVWYKERIYISYCPGFDKTFQGDQLEFSRDDKEVVAYTVTLDNGNEFAKTVEAELKSDLWAKVSTVDGAEGWLKNPDALCMSKHGSTYEDTVCESKSGAQVTKELEQKLTRETLNKQSDKLKTNKTTPTTNSKAQDTRSGCINESNLPTLGGGGAQGALKKFGTGTDGCAQVN